MLNIEKLSRSEKLRMMEALWDDLAHDTVLLASPAWHEGELQDAARAFSEKQAEFVAWDVAKKVLRDGTV